MSNAAIDYEKQEALNMSRMQPPKAGDFNVPQKGFSDKYNQGRLDSNFRVPQRGYADNYADSQNQENGNEAENHSERLNRARQNFKGNNPVDDVKNLAQDTAKMATPMGAASVLKQIDFLKDIPYAAAIGAAILKDISDMIFVGSLPGLGTVISICASIFIFMMMLLVGAGEKRKMAMGIIKKGMVIFSGTALEFIPGLNFIPIETVIAGMVYYMTLSERKHLKDSQEKRMDYGEDEEDES